MSDNEAGWQPDPTGQHDHRYWDGSRWTENVADAGVASTDPYVAPTEPTPTAVDPTLTDAPPAPDPTSTWPAAPAPPLPYAPGGQVEPDGGSKKGLLIGGAVLAAILIGLLAWLALKDDDGDDSDTDTVAQTTQPEDEATDDTADDTATTESTEATEDTVGDDASAEELRDACTDGDFAACDQLYFLSELGSDDEEFGSTCGDRAEPQSGFCEATNGGEDPLDEDALGGGDPEEMLADIYESSMGLSQAQAQCLAGKVAEVMGEGSFDEEEAAAEMFDFLSECDISLDDIQPG